MVGKFAFGHNHRPAGLAVEPVDDAGVFDAADPFERVTAVV